MPLALHSQQENPSERVAEEEVQRDRSKRRDACAQFFGRIFQRTSALQSPTHTMARTKDMQEPENHTTATCHLRRALLSPATSHNEMNPSI